MALPFINGCQNYSPADRKKSKETTVIYNVTGRNIETLRENLLRTSEEVLISGKFTPINVKLDIKNLSASFSLDDHPSRFSKLSLLYGPAISGCESCKNAMIKNPGSVVLFTKLDPEFEYEIIAISKE